MRKCLVYLCSSCCYTVAACLQFELFSLLGLTAVGSKCAVGEWRTSVGIVVCKFWRQTKSAWFLVHHFLLVLRSLCSWQSSEGDETHPDCLNCICSLAAVTLLVLVIMCKYVWEALGHLCPFLGRIMVTAPCWGNRCICFEWFIRYT